MTHAHTTPDIWSLLSTALTISSEYVIQLVTNIVSPIKLCIEPLNTEHTTAHPKEIDDSVTNRWNKLKLNT